MKKFKLHKGLNEVYDISKENYENITGNSEPYEQVGGDEIIRYFAVCPACDNPIQIVGLYSQKILPYGKHYNRDVEDIAKHNEQAYNFCPYASHAYNVNKDSRREKLTDFEKSIFYSVRDNFDLAIYVIERETGIHVTKRLAERMLRDYIASRGYMYYWATLYNIPWMLLYFMRAIPCYGLIFRKESEIWNFMQQRKDVKLCQCDKIKSHDIVDKNTGFLNLYLTTMHHKRMVVNDEVKETIKVKLYESVTYKPPIYKKTFVLEINEYYFQNLVCNAKYRNQKWIDMAKEIMGELEK